MLRRSQMPRIRATRESIIDTRLKNLIMRILLFLLPVYLNDSMGKPEDWHYRSDGSIAEFLSRALPIRIFRIKSDLTGRFRKVRTSSRSKLQVITLLLRLSSSITVRYHSRKSSMLYFLPMLHNVAYSLRCTYREKVP